MDTKITIVLVVLALLLGGVAGVLLGATLLTPQDEKSAKVIEAINSKLIPSVVAFGEVASISGGDITLSYGGDTLVIHIKSDAKITSLKNNQDSGQKAELKDIQVGDYLNVGIKISSEGALEGETVLILPAFTRT